jgi:uncharacterized surface protein with fasciclin (FAS1) repeats
MLMVVFIALCSIPQPAGAEPPATASGTAPQVAAGLTAPQTAAVLAKSTGGFKQFLALAKRAKLDDMLSGDARHTFLLPADSAFAGLPSGALQALQDPANRDILRQLVEFHFLASAQGAADLAKLKSVETVQGESLTVASTQGAITRLGPARVQGDPLPVTNGVVYELDTVLVPESVSKALERQGIALPASSEQADSGSMGLNVGRSGEPNAR